MLSAKNEIQLENEIIKLLEKYIQHYTDPDRRYSCPRSPEGCINKLQGNYCNCGRDIRVMEVASIFLRVIKELAGGLL